MKKATTIAFLGCVFWTPPALSCSCMHLLTEEKVDRATHVFTARVEAAELVLLEPGQMEAFGGEFVRARVDIIAALKGAPSSIEHIYTNSQSTACGIPVVVGLEYVFFLDERGVTSICSGTMPRHGVTFGSTTAWLEFVRRYGLIDY